MGVKDGQAAPKDLYDGLGMISRIQKFRTEPLDRPANR